MLKELHRLLMWSFLESGLWIRSILDAQQYLTGSYLKLVGGGCVAHSRVVVGVRQSPLCIREGTPALPKPKRPELASHSDHRHCRYSLPHHHNDILFHHQGEALLI